MVVRNKIKISVLIVLTFGFILFVYTSIEPKWSRQLDSDAVYLDVDSLYKTISEKQKFNQLKQDFLSQWLDTSNCFMEDFQTGNNPDTELKKVTDVYVDNILHTPKYDSVVVLISFYAAWSRGVDNSTCYSQAMKATIDSLGKWHFNCNFGSYWLLNKKQDLKYCAREFRRTMLTKGILDKNKKIDSTFIHRFFTEEIEENK